MKKWYQSKTIWLNAIALILSFMPLLDENTLIAIGLTNPTKYLTIIGLLTAFLNVILRLITTQGISTVNNNQN